MENTKFSGHGIVTEIYLRIWRNWQTRQIQVLLSTDVQVQVLLTALDNGNSNFAPRKGRLRIFVYLFQKRQKETGTGGVTVSFFIFQVSKELKKTKHRYNRDVQEQVLRQFFNFIQKSQENIKGRRRIQMSEKNMREHKN